jgi:SpoVK/Ycf46/Vps4 family AAA+-type ATPase
MRISDVVQGLIGTSEEKVKELFQEAKQAAPCLLFIDEFQALFTARRGRGQDDGDGNSDTLTTALAGCFDSIAHWNYHAGPESMVTVIAATNEPWAIDEGFLRPGRLDKVVYIGPLDIGGRIELIRGILLNSAISRMEQASFQRLCLKVDHIAASIAQLTDGWTGADVTLLCSRAMEVNSTVSVEYIGLGGEIVEHSLPDLQEFLRIMQHTNRSASVCDIDEYLEWFQEH